MADILSFPDVWGWFGDMPTKDQNAIYRQVKAGVQGKTLVTVRDILENAPIAVKKTVWAAWAATADLSGYLLSTILELNETESTAITYDIVKAWLAQADLARYNEAQIAKMEQCLTKFEDRVNLWTRWATQADLRIYKLYDVAVLMSRRLDPVQVVLAREWLKRNGQYGVLALRALNADYRGRNKVNKLMLTAEAINIWKAVM